MRASEISVLLMWHKILIFQSQKGQKEKGKGILTIMSAWMEREIKPTNFLLLRKYVLSQLLICLFAAFRKLLFVGSLFID